MGFYFIKTPKIVQQFFAKYVWSFSINSSKQKTIYLTFDDGPTPEITEWTLNTLKEYNAKATFFCVGKNVENHPNIFQKIIDDKHSIGNHTFNHLNGWKTDTKNYIENVLKANNSLQSSVTSQQTSNSKKQNTNSNSKLSAFSQQSLIQNLATNNQQPATSNEQLATNLFRPPYGKIKSSQAKHLIEKGYKIIMWDVLSADFDKSISKEKCLDNILKNTQNGSVIVFHDSVKAENNLKFVLPKILEYFQKEGYQFSSIALPN